MIETKSAGGVVLNSKNEVVLVTHGSSEMWWGFPKGHIDKGEDALTAARREIAEETGLTDLEFIREFTPYSRYKGGRGATDDTSEMKTIYMFLFRTQSEKLTPSDPQNPEARWVSIENTQKMLANPKDAAFFKEILPLVQDAIIAV